MIKFLIVSPEYDDKSGGIICLYKLSDLLEEKGFYSKVVPFKSSVEIKKNNKFRYFFIKIEKELYFLWKLIFFRGKYGWAMPLWSYLKFIFEKNKFIVIYPEIVSGNPYGATNVVRWLLHKPGFHTGSFIYGPGEMYIKFNDWIGEFYNEGSYTSTKKLYIIDIPLNLYLDDELRERQGTAYCIRKGKGKPLIYHPKDSILIDDLSHEEIAKIFKKVKSFISYDEHTAYSNFAVLSGCESIVIPKEGVDEESWIPDLESRYGIAYGFEKVEWANRTALLKKKKLLDDVKKNNAYVDDFLNELAVFFGIDINN